MKNFLLLGLLFVLIVSGTDAWAQSSRDRGVRIYPVIPRTSLPPHGGGVYPYGNGSTRFDFRGAQPYYGGQTYRGGHPFYGGHPYRGGLQEPCPDWRRRR